MNRLVLVLAVLAITASACATSDAVPFEKCPVTAPLGAVPNEIDFTHPGPVPWATAESGWYGNSALWVSLPPNGVLPSLASQQQQGFLDTKFAWWRIVPGQLTVRTELVGGDEVVEAVVLQGYGDIGFHPSGLLFSKEGCWQITGGVADQELTFVLWICETASFPGEVSAEEREACGAT